MESCWPAGVAIVVAVISALYFYFRRNFNYWKKRGVPHVGGSLIVGSLKESFYFRKHVAYEYQDIYRRMKGNKYCGFFKQQTPALMLLDPELVRDILVKDFNSFHDNELFLSVEADPIFGRNPFFLRGDRWKATRSQLTPAFTAIKIKCLFPLMAEVARGMKVYIESNQSPDGLDAKELCTKYTTDVVASCAFGVKGYSFEDPNAKFRKMGTQLSEFTFMTQVKFIILMLAPWASNFFKVRFSSVEIGEFFRNLLKEVMADRKAKNETRNDFLQLLITIKEKGELAAAEPAKPIKGNEDRHVYTDDDLTAHALTFFTDGVETSSVVMHFALMQLAMHPDVQHRLREEVDSVLEKFGGEYTYEAINSMTYLDMVMSETLRTYPPGEFTSKVCTKPYDLPLPSGGVYRVEVNTPVVIPLYSLHRDPKLFPDPDSFDPERFSDANKNNIIKGSYLPFGDGPRQCLGMRFGLSQVKVGVASLISNFEVFVNPKTALPVEFNTNTFLFTVKGGLWIDFKPLHPQ